jgi:5-methyltetrahydrofolate--homocysteine methyltransferase
LEDKIVGEEAKKLLADAHNMLEKVIEEKWLDNKAVVGIWPANAVGEDIEVYTDESRTKVADKFFTIRQQQKKKKGLPNHSLVDFIAPKDSGVKDYIGGFVVTAGIGIEKHIERFEADHDDYNSIMLKAIADRFAEAFTELMHKKVRKEIWGYAMQENLGNDDLIKESYNGIRPAPGYPACPDHLEKPTLFKLLNAEELTGVTLTESMAMYPAASVSGWYFAHPDSKYFGIGKIEKDQIEDYAERKGESIEFIEKWLGPNLNY